MRQYGLIFAAALAPGSAAAAILDVSVRDQAGRPVVDAVVTLETDAAPTGQRPPHFAVID
jgi:hypothetical protein